MKIAIDGPAGSGKSTVAKLIASELGFKYLDTGAMYRAVAYRAVQNAIDLYEDDDALEAIALSEPIRFEDALEFGGPQRVFIGDLDVTKEIRTPEVDKAVTPTSACPKVRVALVQQQRAIGAQCNSVMEGRDIGTNVFPDAELKVFLSASCEERARRRVLQNQQRNLPADYDEIYADIKRRDEADSTRAVNPLIPAHDAVLLDTTDMSIDEVVSTLVAMAREKQGQAD